MIVVVLLSLLQLLLIIRSTKISNGARIDGKQRTTRQSDSAASNGNVSNFLAPPAPFFKSSFALARSISPANCYVTALSKLDLPYLISRDFDHSVRKRKKEHKTLLALFSCHGGSSSSEISYCSADLSNLRQGFFIWRTIFYNQIQSDLVNVHCVEQDSE